MSGLKGASSEESSQAPIPPPWQPRFSLRGLFLLTLVCCVMGMAAGYFVRSLQGGRFDRFQFILFTLAGPPLLVVVVSAIVWLTGRLGGRRRG